MFEIGLFDVSSGIQIVDVEDNYVIGVKPDFDACCKRVEEYCDLNGIDYDDVIFSGDYL